MKATISSIQGGSMAVAVKPQGKSRGALVLVMGGVLLAGLSGCLRLGFGEGGAAETRASKSAGESAISREVAEMVKLYRICLQKHEDDPVKAKESCGMYKDAIRDLAHRRDVEP
jgi:hypothetical protein